MNSGDLVITVGANVGPAREGFRSFVGAARRARDEVDAMRLKPLGGSRVTMTGQTISAGQTDDRRAHLGMALKETPEETRARQGAELFGMAQAEQAERAARGMTRAGASMSAMRSQAAATRGGMASLSGSITQAAFAAQDFTSVLSTGGRNALGRALMSTMNNVQMLGAMFGPWGLAVTAAAGAVGSILIPKLLETKDAGEEAREKMDKLAASVAAARVEFERGLELRMVGMKAGHDRDFFGAHEEFKEVLKERDEVSKRLTEVNRRNAAETGPRSGFGLAFDFASRNREALSPLGGLGGMLLQKGLLRDFKESAKAGDAELSLLNEKMREINKRFEELRHRKRMIEAMDRDSSLRAQQERLARERERMQGRASSIREQNVTPRERMEREIAETQRLQQRGYLDERDAARNISRIRLESTRTEREEADRLRKENRTPAEQFRDEIQRIAQLRRGGFIDDQTFDRSTQAARRKLGESVKGTDDRTTASVGGSAISTWQAILDSIKKQDDPQKQMLAKADTWIDLTRQMIKRQEETNRRLAEREEAEGL
jgi:hypothetical protein